MKNPIIVSNLKCYAKNIKEIFKLQDNIFQFLEKEKYKYFVAIPDTYIKSLSDEKYKTVIVGAQNIETLDFGAHTGLTNLEYIKDSGAEFSIIGHSEVRKRGETNEQISEKINSIASKITVILCIGENQREPGVEYLDEIKGQLLACIENFDKKNCSRLIIAYEPVWAIGRANPAREDEVLEATIEIRRALLERFGMENAKKIKVIYGGSVEDTNISKFVADSTVDGVLVGRASLNAKVFANIINSLYED